LGVDLLSQNLMDKIGGEMKRYCRYVQQKYEEAERGQEDEEDDEDLLANDTYVKPSKEEKVESSPLTQSIEIQDQVHSAFFGGISSLLKTFQDREITMDKKT